ncbi:hypothetical protein H206_00158 [Candidatus Electrothrix aarhusensis]|uniref:Uncharacterized protein n=1 Tax=Candidatus Electrothrix aarhusensis TaxID=1859131 RepID=A0A444J1W5_9BACT|nr:hypothetical protein H206_00158 [Candidatus Electrothrix aarhusensis]
MSAGSVFRQGTVSSCSRNLIFSQLFSSFAILLALFFLIFVSSAVACMPTIKHVTDSMSPPTPAAGSSATVTYTVFNDSSCDASGYKLAFHSVLPATPECLSGSYSGSNPSFSLAAGATGQVTANIPAVPPETAGCLVYFDILDASGSPLPLLPGGRMYATFGTMTGPGPGLCVAPMPAITSADHVDLGNGEVAVSTEVENTTGAPVLEVDNSSSDMDESSVGQYNGGDSTDQGKNSAAITAFGMCNMTATFGYNFPSFLSRYFGKKACATDCNKGYQSCTADPVNTAIGNFVYEETDAQ